MGRADCCKKLIGTSFESKYWLSLDPCGFTCIFLSISIHSSALYIISRYIVSHQLSSLIIFYSIYLPCYILAIISLLMVWTSNPGAVPLGARPIIKKDPVQPMELHKNESVREEGDDITTDEEDINLQCTKKPLQLRRGIRRCHKCQNNFKPQRSHHDSVTGRCIVKLDHYCPWVGNAVGALNHKFFVLFIFYTCLTSLISLVLLTCRAVYCEDSDSSNSGNGNGGNSSLAVLNSTRLLNFFEISDDSTENITDDNNDDDDDVPKGCDDFYTVPVFYLMIVSLLFLFFTCCMLSEQIVPIKKNLSKIANLKVKSGQASYEEYAPSVTSFNELFGGNTNTFAWHWLLPLPVWFPNAEMRDAVLGYSYKEHFGNEIFDDDTFYDEEDTIANTTLHQQHSNSNSLSMIKNILKTKISEEDKFSKLVEEHDGMLPLTSNDALLQENLIVKED